ncbi:MAG: DUF1553 domain-containing protein [Lentisphaerales bacterium]|nr:DUF1553 domain-containing protein [Lentisphaerales bacterium]
MELKFTSSRINAPDINSRQAFANWITSKENLLFAKSIANRMWVKLMGAPFVGNLTDISSKSRGVNSFLTAELPKIMFAVNFDLKRFQKIIFNSQTYQRETSRTGLEQGQKYAFHGPRLKRLSAEQIWDSVLSLALANPDASISHKRQYGRHDYFYTKIGQMSPDEVVKYIDGANFNREGFNR